MPDLSTHCPSIVLACLAHHQEKYLATFMQARAASCLPHNFLDSLQMHAFVLKCSCHDHGSCPDRVVHFIWAVHLPDDFVLR